MQCLQPRAGHRLRRDAPLFACEGALGSSPRVVDATFPGRKQRKASVIRRRAGITRKDTRVAECDLIFPRLCCIAQRRLERSIRENG
jgi:hypothetical protein